VPVAISPSNPDPLHKQVTDQLRDAVAAGELSAGTTLPSIRDLADELKVSVITVKRSYADLEAEGLIVTRPGLGSFVAQVDRERLRARKLAEVRAELTRTVASAKQFGITASDVARLLRELEEA
jgi:GntR family transcriptional regulator